ncbi:alpha/beta fold hydrolase [Nitratireductor sp. ZSWI3]|uniref:alpha/beta fold hydrolase n=1 Tax=Nitratireductor sp. ZSWI3 TaxID=2966359 RepID=UPI0021502F62|nr:alpha/beta fold hydrolase [Nitratireductor sp. ZSWI3]MCR4265726.1 alpha/beta fold hydrolase [Nitratireductor sp. ZSWI3]
MSERLYADDTGEGGKALVLLHGFAGSHRVWDGVRSALPPGLRIIAHDLPGHGRSLSCPGAGKARASATAVLNDLDARGVNEFHLAGHSFGGAVAVLVACAAPERVSSLTLFAPGGFGPEIAGDLLANRAAADSRSALRAALEGLFGPHAALPPGVLEAAMALDERPGQREKLNEISNLIAGSGLQGVFPRAMLEGLSMPVHVVWGTRDVVLPVRQCDDLPDGFVLHRLDGLGHMLPEEAPQRMAAILRAVLGES